MFESLSAVVRLAYLCMCDLLWRKSHGLLFGEMFCRAFRSIELWYQLTVEFLCLVFSSDLPIGEDALYPDKKKLTPIYTPDSRMLLKNFECLNCFKTPRMMIFGAK